MNVWHYAYDDENRLKEVRVGQDVVYSCVYDAFGRPAIETVGGVTRYLVWEGDELLLEVGTNGAVAVRHVWGAGGYQGYYRETSLTRLALRDGLGHVRGLMSTSKVITDRYVFDAYPFAGGGGSALLRSVTRRRALVGHMCRPLRASAHDVAPGLHNTTEGNGLRFRWNGSYGYRTLYLQTGQQTTNTATLMHVGARHYFPQLRRFLQRDPGGLGAGDPNLYQFAGNQPVTRYDLGGYEDSNKGIWDRLYDLWKSGEMGRAIPVLG